MAAFLRQVGGGEIDRDPFGRQAKADGPDGRPDPLPAFRHRLVRQADDGESRQAGRQRHLDIDGDDVNALEGDSADTDNHGVMSYNHIHPTARWCRPAPYAFFVSFTIRVE